MTAHKKTRPLDQEEQDLLDALEHLDVKKLPPPSPERQKMFRETAANSVHKESSMNIKIDAFELEELKKRAAVSGMNFPSFIREVLHRYITGQLVEKKVC